MNDFLFILNHLEKVIPTLARWQFSDNLGSPAPKRHAIVQDGNDSGAGLGKGCGISSAMQ